jgi:hypothetical protein
MKQPTSNKSKTSSAAKHVAAKGIKPAKKAQTPKISSSTVKTNTDSDNPRRLGSKNEKFQRGLFQQLVNISSKGSEEDKDATFCALVAVNGIDAQNELEAMLGAQMVAIHNASMTMARRLAHVDTLQQQDSAERALNKLTRTYAMQLQALGKYRSGGKQQVTVKHVHVNEGGQAIVGNVETGGSGEAKR